MVECHGGGDHVVFNLADRLPASGDSRLSRYNLQPPSIPSLLPPSFQSTMVSLLKILLCVTYAEFLVVCWTCSDAPLDARACGTEKLATRRRSCRYKRG